MRHDDDKPTHDVNNLTTFRQYIGGRPDRMPVLSAQRRAISAAHRSDPTHTPDQNPLMACILLSITGHDERAIAQPL